MADNTEREAFEVWYLTDEAQHAGMRHGWQGIAWAAWQASSALAQSEPAAIAAPGVAPMSEWRAEKMARDWIADEGMGAKELIRMVEGFHGITAEQPTPPSVKESLTVRPPNCGWGFCSCIECPYVSIKGGPAE